MKLIFGCGYLGRQVAALWQARGEEVHVVTRSPDKANTFQTAGLHPHLADVLDRNSLPVLSGVDTVLYAIGYDRLAGSSMRDVYVQGLQNALDSLPSTISKFLYVSSTGVYGNFDGEWIDEAAPCRPEREGGRVCLAAEKLLREHPLGKSSIVLRMAGIYGPGRLPRKTELLAGEPIAAPENGWLNLIHVEDAARAVLAAEALAVPPSLYLISDGQPVARRDYFRELARLLNAPAPRFVPPDLNAPATQRSASDKRLRNAKLLGELKLSFNYPSHREGLAAIVRSETGE